MIYLTGDIHTKIPGYWEQEQGGSEMDAGIKYLEILKKYNIKCTLFVNGKCFVNDDGGEKDKISKLLGYDVELGGHTYDNFGRMNVIRSFINRRKYGCVYGSNKYQEKDISLTRELFEKFGLIMKSWRTHAFSSNNDTFRILKENNVRYVSDLIGMIKPFKENGLIHMPINIPVDVVAVSYGKYNVSNKDPFASCVKGRIEKEEWFEIIKNRVKENEKNNVDSVLLIHPISMKVMDNFELFEEIVRFLSEYKSGKIGEYKIVI